MNSHHRMTLEATNSDGEQLYVCPEDGCGRRVVLRQGEMVVIDRGVWGALHSGGNITVNHTTIRQ